jgi:hypothetical protein
MVQGRKAAPLTTFFAARIIQAYMNPKFIKELLHAAPFTPFTLVLATGEKYHVHNPDVLNVLAQGQVIYQDVDGPTRFINPLLISEIVKPEAAA